MMVSATLQRQCKVDVEREATYGDQAVVLQDGRLAVTKTLSDFLALFAVQHDASEIWVHGMALVEAQTILRDHVELAAEDGKRFAVNAWWVGQSMFERCFPPRVGFP